MSKQIFLVMALAFGCAFGVWSLNGSKDRGRAATSQVPAGGQRSAKGAPADMAQAEPEGERPEAVQTLVQRPALRFDLRVGQDEMKGAIRLAVVAIPELGEAECVHPKWDGEAWQVDGTWKWLIVHARGASPALVEVLPEFYSEVWAMQLQRAASLSLIAEGGCGRPTVQLVDAEEKPLGRLVEIEKKIAQCVSALEKGSFGREYVHGLAPFFHGASVAERARIEVLLGRSMVQEYDQGMGWNSLKASDALRFKYQSARHEIVPANGGNGSAVPVDGILQHKAINTGVLSGAFSVFPGEDKEFTTNCIEPARVIGQFAKGSEDVEFGKFYLTQVFARSLPNGERTTWGVGKSRSGEVDASTGEFSIDQVDAGEYKLKCRASQESGELLWYSARFVVRDKPLDLGRITLGPHSVELVLELVEAHTGEPIAGLAQGYPDVSLVGSLNMHELGQPNIFLRCLPGKTTRVKGLAPGSYHFHVEGSNRPNWGDYRLD